jgi:glutathione S-transferase
MMDESNQDKVETDGNSRHNVRIQQQQQQQPPQPSRKQYHYKFITNRMCPYAQKVWMALEVLQISYTMVEIPLYGKDGKPDWFLQYNPKGTVPVLVVEESETSSAFKSKDTVVIGGTGSTTSSNKSVSTSNRNHHQERILTNSDEILDFLFHGNPTFPSRHDDQMNSNNWDRQQLINQQLLVVGKAVVQHSSNKSNMLALHKVLQAMEEQMSQQQYKSNHPHPKDKEDVIILPKAATIPSIVDCHTFPFVWRLQLEYEVLNARTYPKLYQWYQDMERNPAVAITMPSQWWWWW